MKCREKVDGMERDWMWYNKVGWDRGFLLNEGSRGMPQHRMDETPYFLLCGARSRWSYNPASGLRCS